MLSFFKVRKHAMNAKVTLKPYIQKCNVKLFINKDVYILNDVKLSYPKLVRKFLESFSYDSSSPIKKSHLHFSYLKLNRIYLFFKNIINLLNLLQKNTQSDNFKFAHQFAYAGNSALLHSTGNVKDLEWTLT